MLLLYEMKPSGSSFLWQVQGIRGLEHHELVNIGALQNSCELLGSQDYTKCAPFESDQLFCPTKDMVDVGEFVDSWFEAALQ